MYVQIVVAELSRVYPEPILHAVIRLTLAKSEAILVYYFKLLLKYEYDVHESFVRRSLFSVF